MTPTRIVFGISALIAVTGPLMGLAKLAYDCRYLDFIGRYERSDSVFPHLSRWLAPFGPLGWWSYSTGLALAIAVAAAVRIPKSNGALVWIFIGSVIQSIAMSAAFLPYSKLMDVMGNPMRTIYPPTSLLANFSMMAISIGLAVFSVARAKRRTRHPDSPAS